MRERLTSLACALAALLVFGGAPWGIAQEASESEAPASAAISALEAFDAFVETWSDEEGPILLGLVGFHAAPRPASWLLLVKDPRDGSLREQVIAKGRLGGERTIVALPGQDLPHLPLRRQSLRVDSDEVFAITSRRAEELGLPFASAHLHLRVRDEGAEPVWLAVFHNASRLAVGHVYLSASTGEILREDWGSERDRAKTPRQGDALTQAGAGEGR
jgi:hypothetical protein